jgi:hypothetical protein
MTSRDFDGEERREEDFEMRTEIAHVLLPVRGIQKDDKTPRMTCALKRLLLNYTRPRHKIHGLGK